jgi:nitrogen regulatory protein PII
MNIKELSLAKLASLRQELIKKTELSKNEKTVLTEIESEIRGRLQQVMPIDVDCLPWVTAERRGKGTITTGKWLIFVRRENVNAVWEKIKKANNEGKLGAWAKCSTAMPRKQFNPNTHVICVYTYDFTDEEDVWRVEGELRKLGIVGWINYKSDISTLEAVSPNGPRAEANE